jgi:IS5 family transposase
VFTTFNTDAVPTFRAFGNAFARLTPETIRQINEVVVRAAVALKLDDGAKLRIDTSVVETDVHYPTDSSLLWDVVRVLSREGRRLLEELPRLDVAFPDRTKRAKRRAIEISRLTAKPHTRAYRRKYQDLVGVAEKVIASCQRLAARAQGYLRTTPLDPIRAALLSALIDKLNQIRSLGQRVVDQTRRRVFNGEQVPPQEKIYSIFEPHTDLIIRGKVRTPVEFGHKIFIAETAGGLIPQYRVLRGNPSDQDHVRPVLDEHVRLFGDVPELLATDRGFYSEDNIAACKQAGVKIECIPQRGGRRTPEREAYERSPEFRAGQRFRAGVEGRLSVLFRGRGMKRCLCQGLQRFEVFVGAAVLANNLLALAALLRQRDAHHEKAAA